ncbi:unnamed protein product [Calypogeia fissa]
MSAIDKLMMNEMLSFRRGVPVDYEEDLLPEIRIAGLGAHAVRIVQSGPKKVPRIFHQAAHAGRIVTSLPASAADPAVSNA